MSYSARDYHFMSKAIRLAEKGFYTTDPNPRVGCVLVKDDCIIGEGWHQKAGAAHAEVNAIEAALANQKNKSHITTQGATAYVTLEPCCHTGKTPPCTNALIEAGIQRVVIAQLDPNPLVSGKGVAALNAAGIKVEDGLLAAQAQQLNPGFIMRMTQQRPYVRLKMAMSLDGRTAMASGESQWISSESSRKDVQRLRARSSALLTGINTVLSDNPAMTVRDIVTNNNIRQPVRIIMDTQLRTPVDAKILQPPGQVVIATSASAIKAHGERYAGNHRVTLLAIQENKNGHLALTDLMQKCAEMEINELQVECGETLAGALMQQQLIDELVIYMAPTLLGSDARGVFKINALKKMSDKINLTIREVRQIENDLRITAIPEKK